MALNQIVSLPAPSSGLGPATDVSTMTGDKSVEISGVYTGRIVLYGSHDGSTYVPVLTFDSGAGAQAYKQSLSVVVRFLKVFRNTSAGGVVTVLVASETTALNNFIALATLTPGSRGPQASVDLWTVVPATGLNVGFSIIGRGALAGSIVLEGSQDNVVFNPIGSFNADPRSTGILEFSPVVVSNIIRYVRVNVLGRVLQSMTVTIGGEQSVAGGSVSSKGLFKFRTYIVNDLVYSADPGINLNLQTPQAYPMPACTVSQLFVKTIFNDDPTATVVTVYKNGVATLLKVTIPGLSTGVVSNVTDSAAFALGDLLDLRVDAVTSEGGNTIIISSTIVVVPV